MNPRDSSLWRYQLAVGSAPHQQTGARRRTCDRDSFLQHWVSNGLNWHAEAATLVECVQHEHHGALAACRVDVRRVSGGNDRR